MNQIITTISVNSFRRNWGIITSVIPKKRGFIPVLKNRRFLVLWSGQIFSQLADKIYLVLMIALIAT
jgi:hypothetical protein